MEQNEIKLNWNHLEPLEQQLENAGVIHTPAFPSLDGYICYYPFQEGYKQLKLSHRLNKATDIILQKMEFLSEQEPRTISTTPFPKNEWDVGRLVASEWSLDLASLAIYEKSLKSELGEETFNHIIQFIHNGLEHIHSPSSLIKLFHKKVEELGQSLPSFLFGRYNWEMPSDETQLTAESSYNLSLYLFGGYTYHLMKDLGVLGYNLNFLDFEKSLLSLSSLDKRAEITIQWAKDYTNDILLTKQNIGYEKAMVGAERFSTFCTAHPYIGSLPSLGGHLNNLANTLIASCKLGLLKEGITDKNWDSKRITKEWKKTVLQLPLNIQDSILIGSPMETLYSFTVNTVAWLEAKGEYDDSHEIIFSYLSYYENRLQQDSKIDKEYSTTLATSFYKYLIKSNRLNEGDYPAIQRLTKKSRVPYRQLAQVYKPKQRITDGTQSFFHYIARGNGNRLMGTSIALSLLLMCLVYFIF